jgi:hypothetical protein
LFFEQHLDRRFAFSIQMNAGGHDQIAKACKPCGHQDEAEGRGDIRKEGVIRDPAACGNHGIVD